MTNGYLFRMPDVRMVRLLTTYDVWELRGGVDNAYPLGPVHVYVDEADLSVAHDVLAPVGDDEPEVPAENRRSPAAVVASVVVLGVLVLISVARLVLMAALP